MTLGSMALTSLRSPQSIIFHQPSLSIKPKTKTTALPYGQLFKKAPIRLVLAKSSLGNEQVFENRAEGIICYVDENGEIICEGYDEGPRFHHSKTHYTRDAEVINSLQRRLLLIANGYETNNGGIDEANALVQVTTSNYMTATDSTDQIK